MRNFIFECGAAFKSLCRDAAFTAAFVAILAVGLGVSAGIYAVTNATLLKGFVWVPNNEQLFYVTTSTAAMYYPDFEAWRTQARSIQGLALVRNSPILIEDGSGSPATYLATELTPDAFNLLGVQPAIGRNFLPSDGESGASPVVLLRHEFWKSRFGMATDVVGRTIRLDGKVATIVGVMPAGFSFPTDQDLWAPLVPTEAARERQTQFGRYAFGRIADGATLAMVREELGAISGQLSNEFPDTNKNLTPVVRTSSEWFVGDRAVLLFKSMFAAAVVIVVMAWANVATLGIIRVIRKSGEFATRLALGASRGRLVRNFVLESMMLSVAAGGIGWSIAKGIIAAYASVQPPNTVSRVWDYTLDWSALAYLCALALASGAAAGLMTAIQLFSLQRHGALRSSARGAMVGGRHRRLYQVLVGSAVAMTMVLLVAAAALTRSFLNVYNAEVGVDTANVISMSLYAQPERYPDAKSRLAFYDEVSRRLKAIPGMKTVALANAAPGDETRKVPFEIASASAGTDRAKPVVGVMTVAAGYFQDLNARVSLGREFGITDTDLTEPVIVVNQRFASQHWPRSSPIGEHVRLNLGRTPGPWLRVVGVVGNIVQNDRTRQSFEPLVYIPHAQNPIPNLFALGRTSINPEALVNAVNKELYAIDPNLAVPGLWSLEERFNRIYGVERNVAILFVCFAIVALIVAASGLYCTVSRAVSERSREIAIRSAIGASTADISRLVLRQALYPTGAGVAVGLVGSAGVHRLMGSELVSVSAMDPVSTALTAAVLVTVASIASAVPILRASKIPPAAVLAQE